jgi:hypothetical protein
VEGVQETAPIKFGDSCAIYVATNRGKPENKFKKTRSSANVNPEKVIDQHPADRQEGQYCQHTYGAATHGRKVYESSESPEGSEDRKGSQDRESDEDAESDQAEFPA